jgi:hypothetical protein
MAEILAETLAPKRIQRRRTKGWRMPEGAIYVGRSTNWGNPYVVSAQQSADEAVQMYRRLWEEHLTNDEGARERLIRKLRGKDLVCWCPLDQPCHADVLLELANR